MHRVNFFIMKDFWYLVPVIILRTCIIIMYFQFESNIGDFKAEKKRALDILTKVSSNKPILDVDRAKNQKLAAQDGER